MFAVFVVAVTVVAVSSSMAAVMVAMMMMRNMNRLFTNVYVNIRTRKACLEVSSISLYSMFSINCGCPSVAIYIRTAIKYSYCS